MKVERSFQMEDRYLFDFKLCRIEDGWSQFDTSQDANYFGNWVNPIKLQTICYAEGDIIVTNCDSISEFKTEIEKMFEYYNDAKIDAYGNTEIWKKLGYQLDKYDCIQNPYFTSDFKIQVRY